MVAQVAGRQHGVISHEQLIWAGLSRSAVKRWVAAGRLHRLFRGVYGALWGILTLRPRSPVDVVVPS